MFKKIIRIFIIVVIIIQLGISSFYIARWSWGMLQSYGAYFDTPKEDRIFTTSISEYACSLFIRKHLPEDASILWVPKVSPMVNYYIYPRKIYQVKEFLDDESIELEKDFLTSRKIGYVFFDYDKFYPIEYLDIIENQDKVIIVRK